MYWFWNVWWNFFALFIGATAGALLTKFATIIGGTTVGLAIGPGLIICGMAAISSTVVGTPTEFNHTRTYDEL